MARFTFDTTRLKEQVEDNPLVALGIGAALLGGVAKILNANTARKNARTWKKEVDRRSRNTN